MRRNASASSSSGRMTRFFTIQLKCPQILFLKAFDFRNEYVDRVRKGKIHVLALAS
jgi:hypothetical protein